MKSGKYANSLSGAGSYLIILREAARVVEPSQGAFHNPAFGSDFPFRLDAR